MKPWGLPLWDMLTGRKKPQPTRPPLASTPAPEPSPTRARPPAQARATVALAPARSTRPRRATTAAARGSMAERYDTVSRAMLATHGVKVRKWRTAMSGVAWELKYDDGSIRRYIESPRPCGPMSMAIFLHEVGHHAIGFNRYRPRCLEEYHAWRFALEQMQLHGLNITEAVRYRVHASLYYAIAKAQRRGLAKLPPELEPYLIRPTKYPRKTTTPKPRRRAR